MKLFLPLNIGAGNFVIAQKVVAIVDPYSSPVKQLIQEARKKGLLLNATKGRKTRTAILMDNGTVILSTLSPQVIARRLEELQRTYEKKLQELGKEKSEE
ncbi:DUF370 domain-containing protein [bacterium]|nr:DUF370 domain-containing protein [bacterium]